MQTGTITPEDFVKNINTFKARTLLVNKRTKDMTSSDWTSILSLVNSGLTSSSDYAFLVKTYADNSKSVIDKDWGSASSFTGYNDTYKVSERLLQDFNTGDKRFENNFELLPSAEVNKRGRGITFGTRYQMTAGGTGNGAYTYFHFDYGVDNFYIGASYEENQLMKAEALINTDQIEAGLAIIDAVRDFQGAGVAATAGNSFTKEQALEELRKERRTALFLRGLAFYDLRRMGYADPVSQGGGRHGAYVLDAAGNLNTNATIDYSYMSYWDVPQNELDFNPTATGVAVKNPN